jgi:hypothetical protein
MRIKARPIIFSTEMAKAVLDERKNVTRRIIKPQPIYDDSFIGNHKLKSRGGYEGISNSNGYISCPYGTFGDRLWVRQAELFK